MGKIALIGGTGLSSLEQFQTDDVFEIDSPYGPPSSAVRAGRLFGTPLLFLPRHGDSHSVPPHKINYRANIWALHQQGVTRIIAVNAVGGITAAMVPGQIVIPDQIVDYSYDREHTFFSQNDVRHVDFSYPYTEHLRQTLLRAAREANVSVLPTGTCAVTQGPRLETAAEIRRFEHDGCDIVGMTGMPEAALARELEIEYVSLAIIVNWAAGKTTDHISMAMVRQQMDTSLAAVVAILGQALPLLSP